MPTVSQSLQEASDALRAGNRVAAWRTLQPALTYPAGVQLGDAEFAQGLEILSHISNGRTSSQAKAALTTAQAKPRDIQALFDVGYLLLDSRLPEIAATALARGNELAPNIPVLINELSTALGETGCYTEAFDALRDAGRARQQDWHTRYLYCFNALMSGHLVEARQGFALLGSPQDDEASVRYERLARFFDRSREVAPCTSLDSNDLRGWHYVITGGLLTHLASGRAATGNGRYRTVRDSYELIHEGVLRAATIFHSWDMCPSQVVYSNDPASEIMANVWHRRIGVPIRPFSSTDRHHEALFVAYDLAMADAGFVETLATRRAGQILCSHAASWTGEFSFASDICTYLYDRNIMPWGTEPASAGAIAGEVVATELTRASLHDLARLARLAATVGSPKATGQRDRMYPVAETAAAE